MEIDRARVDRVQTEISTASLDALICQIAPHVLMLTGYAAVLGQSFAVFPARGEPAVIVPEAELPFARESWCPDVRPYHSTVLDSHQRVLDLIRPHLSAIIAERGLSSARFGVEGSSPMVPASYSQVGFPSAGLLHALRDLFPSAGLVDVGPLLAWLQAQKTEPELARLRRAYDLAALAFEAARGAIQDGAAEAAVAAAALSAVEVRGRQGGATRVLPFVHVMSGPRAGLAYEAFNLTGDRALCFGDPVLVQLEIYADGFWSEMTRTFFVGNPGAEGARIYETHRHQAKD